MHQKTKSGNAETREVCPTGTLSWIGFCVTGFVRATHYRTFVNNEDRPVGKESECIYCRTQGNAEMKDMLMKSI
jgi:hypothetical protein